jgi:hypothetical protein
LEFYKSLFVKMGIDMTPNVEHYLIKKESNRMKKMNKLRTSEAKKEKNKQKYEKLKQHTLIAKKEFHKRQGTYRKGMNMDDPFGELLNGKEPPPDDDRKPPPAKRTKVTGFCEYCGRSDHLTKRSKKCTAPLDATRKYRRTDGSLLADPPGIAPVIEEGVVEEAPSDPAIPMMPVDDAAEEDDTPFTANPFAGEDSDDSDDTLAFIDCETWETDDEEQPRPLVDSNIDADRVI